MACNNGTLGGGGFQIGETVSFCYDDGSGFLKEGTKTVTEVNKGEPTFEVKDADGVVVDIKTLKQCPCPEGCPDPTTKVEIVGGGVDIQPIIDAIEAQKDYEINDSGWICGASGTWERTITPYIDGVAADPADVKVIDSGIKCSNPMPIDPEIFTTEDCVDGFLVTQVHAVTFNDKGEPTAPTALGAPIASTISCGKQTVAVDKCDGTNEDKEVDSVVKLAENFIQVRNIDVPAVVKQATYADGCASLQVESTTTTDCDGVETTIHEVINTSSQNYLIGDILPQVAVDALTRISEDRKTKVTVGGSSLTASGVHTFPSGACGLIATNLGGTTAHFNGHPIEAGEAVAVGQERIGASYTIDSDTRGELTGTYETDGKLKIQFLFCSDIKCIGAVFDNSLKSGKKTTVDTKGQDNVCEGQDITYSFSNAVNCTVVNNNDGTWDVTPSVDACGDSWSFDRTLTCADGASNTAPVSGNVVSNVTSFPIHFDMNAGAIAKLRIVLTSSAGKYDIDWGDGTTDIDNASNALVSHTYGADFNGNVVVRYLTCFDVRDINTNGNTDAVAGDEPAGILKLNYGTVNTASGDIGSFRKSIQRLYATNNNTIGGDIINTSEDLIDLRLSGKTTLGGDIGAAHEGLAIISATGFNTLYGDANTMPSTITSFSVTGLTTIGGTTVGIDPNNILTYYNLQGQNTLSDDIANFKSLALTTLAVKGSNTLDGIINNILSDVLRDLIITGNNTTGGTFGTDLDGVTVPDLSPLLRRLELAGDSTFGGINGADVALMPASLQELRLDSASSYLVGDITSPGSTGIKVLRSANADLTGQFDLIPWANCTYFVVIGSSTIAVPNSTWPFSTTFSELKYRSDQPLSQAEVDNMLKACESVTTWTGYKRVEINGSGASAPSPAGLASKATLEAQGVTVLVN